MKIKLILIISTIILISPTANALDWGLGNMITTNINNIFSKASKNKAPKHETLADFINEARVSGYTTQNGDIDFNRINNNPEMLARLNSIMNTIQPAAGPAPKKRKMILQTKPENTDTSKELRDIK